MSARLTNSGQLSLLRTNGQTRSSINRSSSSIRCWLRIGPVASIHKLSLLKSSTTVKSKIIRPDLVWRRRRKRPPPVATISLAPFFRGYLKPCCGPDPGRSVTPDCHTIMLQKDANTARGKAWIESRVLTHIANHRRILKSHPVSVSQPGSRKTHQRTGA